MCTRSTNILSVGLVEAYENAKSFVKGMFIYLAWAGSPLSNKYGSLYFLLVMHEYWFCSFDNLMCISFRPLGCPKQTKTVLQLLISLGDLYVACRV